MPTKIPLSLKMSTRIITINNSFNSSNSQPFSAARLAIAPIALFRGGGAGSPAPALLATFLRCTCSATERRRHSRTRGDESSRPVRRSPWARHARILPSTSWSCRQLYGDDSRSTRYFRTVHADRATLADPSVPTNVDHGATRDRNARLKDRSSTDRCGEYMTATRRLVRASELNWCLTCLESTRRSLHGETPRRCRARPSGLLHLDRDSAPSKLNYRPVMHIQRWEGRGGKGAVYSRPVEWASVELDTSVAMSACRANPTRRHRNPEHDNLHCLSEIFTTVFYVSLRTSFATSSCTRLSRDRWPS